MLKRFLLSAASVLVIAGCAPKAEKIHVMSYNIRHSLAKDGDNSWEFRKDATTKMLEAAKPDIFGVQEARPDQIAFIEETCPVYKSYGVGRDDGIEKGEHMSVFYNSELLEMEEHGTWWLSETPDSVSFGWDAKCRRTATWALMKVKKSGKRFYFVNTHLDHVGVNARYNGLALVAEKVAGMNPENYPMVLTGDFNVEPGDPCLDALDGIMLDARTTAKKSTETASFNGWGNMRATVIDYIFYRGFASCESFDVLTESFAGKPYISDHYPIVSTLVF